MARYPASYPATATWRSSHRRCGFLSAFAHRHSLLGHPVPARGIPPLSRLAYRAAAAARTLSGFPRSARVRQRPGWVPSLLRGGGVVPATATSMTGACRFTTASPSTPLQHPIGEGWDHEAYEDSPIFTRPVFPSPTIPGWNGDGFGFSPWASHPTVTHDARQGGDGPS